MRRELSPTLVVAALAAAFVLAGVVAWRPGGDPGGGPAPPVANRSAAPEPAAGRPTATGVTAVTCISFDGWDSGYCERLGLDRARRSPLTDGQRATAEAALDGIRATAWTGGPPDAAAPFTASDVDRRAGTLAAAGHPDAQVRLARAADPAPPGALLVAVPVEGACVVRFEVPGGTSSEWVDGPLPGGRCLDP